MATTKSLSASSIKSIDSCSWIYWSQYERKIPQKANEGALRGNAVHLIFELLLNSRHRECYEQVKRAGSVNGSPALRRLLIKELGRSRILNVSNYELCDKMILVGLNLDFFGHGGRLGKPEFRFEIVSEAPKYKIRGIIDKHIFYGDNRLKIVDYKSSKAKFSGDDLEANPQSMAYSLAGYKLFNVSEIVTQFIFLRFPHRPIQEVRLTRQQLAGFEHYVAYMYELVQHFSLTHATSNLAVNNKKNQWMCKSGAWECPYMRPFQYYALVDENGTIARTALYQEDLKAHEGQQLITLQYEGCPAFKGISAPDEL